MAVIIGVEQNFYYFVLDLPHSDGCLVDACPTWTSGMSLPFLLRAFRLWLVFWAVGLTCRNLAYKALLALRKEIHRAPDKTCVIGRIYTLYGRFTGGTPTAFPGPVEGSAFSFVWASSQAPKIRTSLMRPAFLVTCLRGYEFIRKTATEDSQGRVEHKSYLKVLVSISKNWLFWALFAGRLKVRVVMENVGKYT